MNSTGAKSDSEAAATHALYAVLLFSLVFSPLFFRSDYFWYGIVLVVLALNALAWRTDKNLFPLLAVDARTQNGWKIAVGLFSAGMLYAVFMAGRWFLGKIFPSAAAGIADIYGLRAGQSSLWIVIVLVWVGTGEELFWRHHLQRWLSARWGNGGAAVAQSILYAFAHWISMNPALIGAAWTAGLFWGVLYARWRSPLLNVVSHVVWDVLVFVALPLEP